MIGLEGEQAAVVERIYKGQDLQANLIDLSRFWKIKVWFNQPTEIRITPTWINKQETENGWSKTRKYLNTGTEHVIARFFSTDWGKLCYLPKRTVKGGFHFPDLSTVVKYEVILDEVQDEFKSYEKFAAKFDRRFMPDAEILSLWNSKSGQHGGRYKPSDFHKIGPRGKQVLNNFLRLFVDWNTEGKCYIATHHDNGTVTKVLSDRYRTYHQFGRNITIEHTLGIPRVFYSSEYCNSCNGRYGLLANKNEFLHLEDD